MELNHPEVPFTLGDLTSIPVDSIPKMDLITAGFPCQPFSIAGYQKGFDDPRSNVFWKIIEIMEYHRPRYVVLENVKNLTSHDNGNTFKVITGSLTKLGYHIKYKVVNTCDFTSLPQNRPRIYIVACRNQVDYEQFDFPSDSSDPRLSLSSLLENSIDAKYIYSDRFKCYPELVAGIIKDISTDTVYQYRRTGVRENKSGVCPTLTANMGAGGHNVPLIKQGDIIRKLTPRECFSLQGFPSSYQLPKIADSSLYKLAGNAITVSVAQKIIKCLPQ